ncbi:MAG: hypothetical protein PHU14_15740 [Methylovulum sp.]|nr:hypothetical protein [Methylovulum sp.]
MRIKMSLCKKWLVGVWFSFGAILFLIMVVTTMVGAYENIAESIWSWFLPSLMPTLSLMIAVLVVDNQDTGRENQTADRFLFGLSLGISIFYLLLLILVIFIQPFTHSFPEAPLEGFKKSNLWLGPLQGLVAAALGAFFINKKNQ